MNPISSVVQGAYKAASSGAKNTAKKAASGIPNPSEAVYNLGMGIGPMLRSIADEMKRDKQKDSKDSGKKDGQLIGRKDLAQISTQFNTMITVLKDLKSIGMMQLRADQQRMLDSRRQSFFDKEAALESGAVKPQLTATQGPGGTDGAKSAFGGALGAIMGLFTPGKLIAAGGLAAIWAYILDDDNKRMIKRQSRDLVGGMISKTADAFTDAFKSANVQERIGMGLGAAFAAIAAGIYAKNSIVYKVGAGIAQAANPELFKAATPAATTSAVSTNAAAATAAAATRAAPAGGLRSGARLAQEARIAAEAAEAAKLAEVAKTSAEVAKTTNLMGKTVAVASKALGGLAVGLNVYNASNEFKEGKAITGTLSSLSAATGALALAAGVTGVGAPVALAAGGISALLGVASMISGAIEQSDAERAARSEAPTRPQPSAQQGQSSQPVVAMTAGDEKAFMEKYGDIVGQRESGGNYSKVNSLGFLGKYQFGAAALEDLGYLKKDASKKVGSNKDQGTVLDDPSNWARGFNKEKFLNDPRAQEEAFVRFTHMNMKVLKSAGVITDKTTQSELSGILMAAHLAGPGGVKRHFEEMARGKTYDPSDAYGTSLSKYMSHGTQAFDGTLSQSITTASAGAVTPNNISGDRANDSSKVSDPTTDFVAQLMKLMTTGSASVINIDQSKTSSSSGGVGMPSFTGGVNDSNIRSAVSSVALPA